MAKKPTVSVLCLTYNQAPFIRQMLDSVLSQKTTFDFEILINDDASNDGTVDILKEYQQKYPDIVKPIFQKENLYSQGLRNFVVRFLLPKAKGKYLALCEGDDYWTDNNKLQLQVNFLEKHPDYAICFHPVRVFFENKEVADSIFPNPDKKLKYTKTELIKENFIQTNSVMYRRQKYQNMQTNVTPGDWYLHVYHAQFGKIGFINRVMAAYRRHSGGIWWNAHNDIDGIWEMHGIAHIALYHEMLRLNKDSPEHTESIRQLINTMLDNLLGVDIKYGTDLFEQAITKYPDELKPYIVYAQTELFNNLRLLDESKQQLSIAEAEIGSLKAELDVKNIELKALKSSRFWKLRNHIAKLVGKPVIK